MYIHLRDSLLPRGHSWQVCEQGRLVALLYRNVGRGITSSDSAISLGQSAKWSWRLFLLSRCTSSFFSSFPSAPEVAGWACRNWVQVPNSCRIFKASSAAGDIQWGVGALFFFSQWGHLGSAWRPGHTSELCWSCSRDLVTHRKWVFFKLVIKQLEK